MSAKAVANSSLVLVGADFLEESVQRSGKTQLLADLVHVLLNARDFRQAKAVNFLRFKAHCRLALDFLEIKRGPAFHRGNAHCVTGRGKVLGVKELAQAAIGWINLALRRGEILLA